MARPFGLSVPAPFLRALYLYVLAVTLIVGVICFELDAVNQLLAEDDIKIAAVRR